MSRPMIATDLDGTLLDSRSRLSAANRDALVELGKAGVIRAIVTGRSLFSALKVIEDDWPIDYLVFSTGVGVVRWRDRELVRALHMAPAKARTAAQTLVSLELDFMVHAPVPDNHHFWFRRAERRRAERDKNEDFERRLALYAKSARELSPDWPGSGEAEHVNALSGWQSSQGEPHPVGFSQLLAVDDSAEPDRYHEVVRRLSDLSVVRSTSPLDHASWWIEIYPRGASKSAGVAWLCETERLERTEVTAIGNDYNDEDMLAWAPSAWVVANAAAPLLDRFPSVSSNDADGFAEAAERVLSGR